MHLTRLLARHASSYWRAILAVIVFQLITTLATLYLPDLNAAIIDKGVAQGDVPYILSLIHISEPTRRHHVSRMPSSA